MSHATTVTIAPNEKYREVILGEVPQGGHKYADVAEAYRAVVEAPPTDEFDMDYEDMQGLSWDLLTVTCNTDLVEKMATYFEGVDPDEPTDLIRAKLRLLDAEIYVDAQVAAREELP